MRKKKKRRVDETESKALKQALPPSIIQPPKPAHNDIFKHNKLICQGTYFRDKDKIFIGDGVTLIKRGLDLLVYLEFLGITGYIARLHKTKEKNIYLFVYCDDVFRIDLSMEITAVIVKIARSNNIVQFFSKMRKVLE